MKGPHCPKCETQHYSTQPCSKVKKQGNEGAASAGLKQSGTSGMLQGPPLTPAERQKLWRTTGDVEGKREANRLRMRRKRG